MEIIISLFILSAIILPIAIYKRSKSIKFRLVQYNSHGDSTKLYSPQIRIDGVWFNLKKGERFMEMSEVKMTHGHAEFFLDPHDAITLIELFKLQNSAIDGNFYISSNRKLNSNEKEIIVE